VKRSWIVLLVVAGGLALVLILGHRQGSTGAPPPVATAPPRAPGATPTDDVAPKDSGVPAPTGAPGAAAKADVSAFLNAWLAYLYGRGTLQAIPNVSDYVRAELDRTLSYVEEPSRRAGGQAVVATEMVFHNGGLLEVTAHVVDAQPNSERSFTILMAQQGSHWVVIRLPDQG
jgi:hypothetical protein